jgi:hypothetical protein
VAHEVLAPDRELPGTPFRGRLDGRRDRRISEEVVGLLGRRSPGVARADGRLRAVVILQVFKDELLLLSASALPRRLFLVPDASTSTLVA